MNVDHENVIPEITWYYATNGKKDGPLKESEIPELVKAKKINDLTLVWNDTYQDWKPIMETNLATYVRSTSEPPPLVGGAVNNTYAWLTAFAPLIGSFLESTVSAGFGISVNNLWFITVLINIIFVSMDEKKLKQAGHDTSKFGSFFLIPVYLFKRAKLMKQPYYYAITWCLMFILLLLGV